MKSLFKYLFIGIVSATLLSIVWSSNASDRSLVFYPEKEIFQPDTCDTCKVELPYPFEDVSNLDPLYYETGGNFKLDDPANLKEEILYDPDSNQFTVTRKAGNLTVRRPTYLTFDEYLEYDLKKQVKDYWKQRNTAESNANAANRGLIPPINIRNQRFIDIFGGSEVSIVPQGTAELTFAANINKTDNPALPEKQRKVATFDFSEKIQLNVVGKIGTKLKLTTNYNTEASFDFENQMKLEYTGDEDDIIKTIEAGNVNMALNSSLISGSQSLFGVKTKLQFGRLSVTNVFSQEKGKKSEVEVTGGAQVSNYEVAGDNYEANKHFFLSQYFRDLYTPALANLPVVNSPVNITKIEVWVTNRNSATENIRNIVSFTDLGERTLRNPFSPLIQLRPGFSTPHNDANSLYDTLANAPNGGIIGDSVRNLNSVNNALGPASLSPNNFIPVKDWEKLENARKLSSSEYTVNKRLGFISLNQALNYDEVLAVSYQYTINNDVFQVGDFSDDGIPGQRALFTKMLKSTNVSPRTDTLLWNLMMKNVYSIGAYQVNPQDFKLDIWYNNPATGTEIKFIPEGLISGQPLIEVMNADKLNSQLDALPDGVFDFIEGVTINPANGRVFIPVLEPFGAHLYNKLYDPNNPALALKYSFPQLYDSTKTAAQQIPEKNRFRIRGSFKSSSSSEISLNAVNIPQGSVVVTSGGVPLVENQDYTVDYALGRVKIINEGILQSGSTIKISLESNSLFNIQTKTLFGTHLDYRINKDFELGATFMNLTERPITQKVNAGDEPIKNSMAGFNMNYRTETPFITRMVDKLPFLETKEVSNITFTGEVATLIPGHSRAIGKDGNAYVDDFEGTQSTIDIKSPSAWSISSVPSSFPEASQDSLVSGYNRAKLAWYVIDPLFLRSTNGLTPSHLDNNSSMSNHFTREILENEIFPNKESVSGQPINIPVLDVAYYPSERGPYNFDPPDGETGISRGIDANGLLNDPETRWGGIMRKIETNDFEAANIEFIQFWMMDPFHSDNGNPNTTGELLFNLGNISEDILKDSRKSFENGLPVDGNLGLIDETPWARVPVVQAIVNAFDNDPANRKLQDVGFDGVGDGTLSNAGNENTKFQQYLNEIAAVHGTSSAAYQAAIKDPSADNFHYYRGSDYDAQQLGILQRYKMYNGVEGNSLASGESNDEGIAESYPTQATTIPNAEDINRDNTLSEGENYYQYRVELTPNAINQSNVGSNFISDVFTTTAKTKSGDRQITWYQFRIPVRSFETKVGEIDDFKSIRFIRMFFKNVDNPVVLRFARLELVRSDWRKYNFSLLSPGDYLGDDNNGTTFEVAAVNIEENGSRVPVNYVLPPGIDREQNAQSTQLVRLNEQSMVLKVCELEDGDSRAAFKTTEFDVRSYKKLKMYIHAEAGPAGDALNNGDLTCFVRLGTDFTDNYYEYEIPLLVTPPGSYNGGSDDDRYRVWPEGNNMELEFAELQQAKQQRNEDILSGTAQLTQEKTYTASNGRRISIRGNPNLATVRTIMIGVRNPRKELNPSSDDGSKKCGEVWVNELRLTDFDEKGGWASVARMTAKLADFGTLTLAGNIYTPGFGSIEKKVSERRRDKTVAYDIASQLELGKFFPEKTGIKIPMYVGFAESRSTPQYNPLDPDIEMKNLAIEKQRELKKIVQDYTKRRSINFTNVKKERAKGNKKMHFYDVENLSLNYAYTEIFRRNYVTEYNTTKNYRGGLAYNYSIQPKNIRPFAKNKAISKSKYLMLIRDFNFNTMPNQFSFLTDVERNYNENLNRNTLENSDVIITPTYTKSFSMNRLYDLKYDLTKSLKLDFSANNQSRIMEPEGRIDTEEKRDSVRESLLGLGKTTNYRHSANINWTLPINKIPMLEFISASVRYGTTFDWMRAPFSADSLGNTIQNTQQWQWNGQANMVTLYNKIPYFKKVNTKKRRPASSVAVTDSTKKKKVDFTAGEVIARLVMTVKTISVNYTENFGTALPGYANSTQILGMDPNFDAPGAGFVFGQQENFGNNQDHFGAYAAQQGWLVQTQSLNNPFSRTSTKNFNARANLEPLPDIRIELTANRNRGFNRSEIFRWNGTDHESFSPQESGNFSMSFLTWRTAFLKDNKDHESKIFEDFLNNRIAISQKLAAENPWSAGQLATGFEDGYSATSQDVMIPAFLAAYSGKSPTLITTNPFPILPKPNWRITYDGLTKLEKVRKYFKTVTLNHAYRSTYNVGSFTNNLDFRDLDGDGFSDNIRNTIGDFESQYSISTVTISEQLSPLLNIEVTYGAGKNPISTRVEIKKDRSVTLSTSSYQVTEVSGREIVAGVGYTIRDKNINITRKLKFKSDLKLRADVSYRNNQTIIRKIVDEFNQLTSGQNILSIKTSADYQIGRNLSVRAFYDRIMTNPLISTSFKTTNTNAGVSLRFMLGQ